MKLPMMPWNSVIIAVVVSCFTVTPAFSSTESIKSLPRVTCNVRWVHDGDTFRCDGYQKSTRLYGVDAPEMPGSCRVGRSCVAGDPYAAKAQLERLIGGRALQCVVTDTDRYRRPVMRCTSAGKDLSCAMVRSGKAVERYGKLGC